MASRLQSSTGAGYAETQWNKARLGAAAEASRAAPTSSRLAIPVEISSGTPRSARWPMNVRFVSSPDGTFRAGTPKLKSRSALARSNGVERNRRSSSRAWSESSFHALRGSESGDWSALPMMNGVGSISGRLYVPKVGWTSNMDDVNAQLVANINGLKVPQLGNAPLPRSVTGLEVSVGAQSLHWPVTRVFLVGE